MSEPEELDCWNNDLIVCPWCGHEHDDCGDWFGESNTSKNNQCHSCGGRFDVERDFSTTYTTTKAKP